MPRVLRILNRFNLGGIAYNVAYLSKYLAPEFETLLIGGEKQESEESSEFIIRNLGVEPRIIPEMSRSIRFLKDYSAYKKIRKIIREFKPDIVHTHAAKAGALGRMAAKAEKVPVIVHTFHGHVFHSYFGSVKTGIIKVIERKLAGSSDAIVAISEKQKEELTAIHNICEKEKVRVIPLGFDLDRFRTGMDEKRAAFRKKIKAGDDLLVVSTVGRLVPVKNHELFIRGIAELKKTCPGKIRGVIAGDGEKGEALKSYAASLGLNESDLVFTSWIKEVDQVYAGSDIVAMTSFNEGTPVSLIEAQASGRPVISSRVGGIENIVNSETGILFNVQNEDAFFYGLSILANQPDMRKKMGAAGWSNVGAKFHYTRLVEDMRNLYHALLAQKVSGK